MTLQYHGGRPRRGETSAQWRARLESERLAHECAQEHTHAQDEEQTLVLEVRLNISALNKYFHSTLDSIQKIRKFFRNIITFKYFVDFFSFFLGGNRQIIKDKRAVTANLFLKKRHGRFKVWGWNLWKRSSGRHEFSFRESVDTSRMEKAGKADNSLPHMPAAPAVRMGGVA